MILFLYLYMACAYLVSIATYTSLSFVYACSLQAGEKEAGPPCISLLDEHFPATGSLFSSASTHHARSLSLACIARIRLGVGIYLNHFFLYLTF